MSKTVLVVKREGKSIADEAEFLNISEIKATKSERIKGENRTVIYTEKEEEFIYCTGNDQILKLLSQEDGFFITDRGCMVNLTKDIKVDYDERLIFYRAGGFITIAKSKLKSLKEYMERIFAR